ncbi:hypothetical protein L2E82_45942 [Cichorium intybus]|uniref:Uncharacterized protein n=1 Tax=Cichorium intybus TaxID=13427 RepID=A0ACB8ZVB9_CICIN|nr:hypothetical protein L2E82_45942 [Cichorium intybus]
MQEIAKCGSEQSGGFLDGIAPMVYSALDLAKFPFQPSLPNQELQKILSLYVLVKKVPEIYILGMKDHLTKKPLHFCQLMENNSMDPSCKDLSSQINDVLKDSEKQREPAHPPHLTGCATRRSDPTRA